MTREETAGVFDAGRTLARGFEQVTHLSRNVADKGHGEEMRKSDKSLMPERVLSDLTAQEAADLFEYIRHLGATAAKSAGQ